MLTFLIQCIDGAQGMLQLPEKSVKLVYGSPPYPNAETRLWGLAFFRVH